MLICGDALVELRKIESDSVDALVTDPPYGLSKAPDVSEVMRHWLSGTHYSHAGAGFMGKEWDSFVPGPEYWRECYRVIKPGAHGCVFAGTRTQDLMSVALRFAGFEIRDTLCWLYGSGFPKSLDISKAIDKAAGAEREVIGKDAKQWQGWGTALKPAHEPIILIRKPLERGRTVASNVLTFGTGALNIDASRIATTEDTSRITNAAMRTHKFGCGLTEKGPVGGGHSQGRFPANLVLSHNSDCQDTCTPDCPVAMLDEQSGNSKSTANQRNNNPSENLSMSGANTGHISFGHNDSGGASRFFYCAKASKSERNAGCEGLPDFVLARSTGSKSGNNDENPNYNEDASSGFNKRIVTKNHHPTVKPQALMRYLITLIAPPHSLILDPFSGSGSTGVAAHALGHKFIGIERESEYIAISQARIDHEKTRRGEVCSLVSD